MNKNPLVSVIMPSYNQGRFIEKAVLSILNQTYPNVELIVVDGGSGDETRSVLQKYDNKIRWISEPDRGESHAMNKGIRMASGEIFNFPCSDEELRPEAIKLAVETLLKNPGAGMTFGDQGIVDEKGNILGCKRLENVNLETLLNLNPGLINQPGAFIRKNVFDKVGCWDENLHYSNDFDLWVRILSRFKRVYIPQTLAFSTVHDAEKGATNIHGVVLENFRLRRKYKGRIFSKANFNMFTIEIKWFFKKIKLMPALCRMKKAICFIIFYSSFLHVHSLFKKTHSICILNGHRIVSRQIDLPILDSPKNIGLRHAISMEDFDERIRYLARNYEIISLNEAVGHFKKDNINKDSIVLTFDDGYKDIHTLVFPVLKKYNLPATFFLTSDLIGREGYIGLKELKEMAASPLVTFGAHSVTHVDLSAIPDEQFKYELMESKRRLSEDIGRDIEFFAYPYGRFNDKLINATRGSGYICACATGKGMDKDLFCLKRTNLNIQPFYVFALEVSGILDRLRRIKNCFR